ncbi:Hypothetical protein CINCED_3A015175 [Cinara cedri]|uniref:Reverse transcriptase zinc-binding domain n=1 Tax=Cinara cedri TaxID=506608 RepID=A0A5E4NJ58_9HEMI|nr:Hypothetical protein CINCED_3A015175 [Cinara cedri]
MVAQWLPVLSNIIPPELRRLMKGHQEVTKVMNNPELPLYNDIISHPQKRLKSRHPIWDLTFPKESIPEVWKNRWKDSGVQNSTLIADPMMRVPGFNLPRHLWTALNRAMTNQDRSKSLLYKWSMTNSPLCACGAEQTIQHVIEECPNTKFNGGIARLHKAEEDVVTWINNLEFRL